MDPLEVIITVKFNSGFVLDNWSPVYAGGSRISILSEIQKHLLLRENSTSSFLHRSSCLHNFCYVLL